MMSLINNFVPYFLYSNKYDKSQVAAKDVFAKQEYLAIFDHQELSFMVEIC